MKKDKRQKAAVTALLTATCIGMALSGCTAEEKPMEGQTIESTVPSPGPEAEDAKSLYEQFLSGSLTVTVSNDYPEDDYSTPILEKGSSYTLTELKECTSKYFLNPEYTSKTTCDHVQYTYVKCPDSPDTDSENLLVKFVGLDIYSKDDHSYAVFVVTEDNGQLYVTDEYECWARSWALEYADGTVGSFGSSGAGDNYDGLSAILSNGKLTDIYSTEILSGWWTSYVNDSIYHEVFDNNAEPSLIIAIHTIGEEKYYQYDMGDCPEETKEICMDYISRCREGQGIRWVTEEELQTAVEQRCSSLGIDYGIIQQQEEAVWKNL